MIPVLAYRIALYGLIAATLVALGIFTRLANRRWAQRDAPLPEARTRPARSWVILIPALVMFASPPLAWKLFRARHWVAIAREADGTIEVVRRVALGEPAVPRAPAFASASPLDVWVINQTSRELRISEPQYGGTALLEPRSSPIPVGTAAIVYSLDFIGPDDPPPSSVRVDERGAEGILAHASRGWLTWDR